MPTYNRKDKALVQASNIISQIEQLNDVQDGDVEFFISDNCSTDHTDQFLKDKLNHIPPFVRIVRQKTNIQSIGNMNYLFNNSDSDYVWIIGDDDIVNEGAVFEVKKEILESRKAFYLLNFQREVDGILQPIYWEHASQNYESLYRDGLTGGFGFITVTIFRKKDFIPTFQNMDTPDNMLMYPMARTFYGLFVLNGKMIFDHSFVIHHTGDYHWFSKYVEVQSIYSYKALLILKELVSHDKFLHLLKILFRTDIFRYNSFKYLLKTRDVWYYKELRRYKILNQVLLCGVTLGFKAIIHKLIR